MQLRLVDTEPQPHRDFDQFWQAYPRRVNKSAARRAYMQALRIASSEAIYLGAVAYAQWCGSNTEEAKYIAHASTWLNDARWEDEYETDDIAAALDEVFK